MGGDGAVDGLTVTSGAATSVETDAVRLESVRLSAVAHVVDEWAVRATGVLERSRVDPCGGPALAPDAARAAIALARDRLGAVARGAARRATDLGASAAGYERAELLADVGRRIAAGIIGSAAPAFALAAASGASIALGPAWLVSQLVSAVDGRAAVDAALEGLVLERGLPMLSDPAFVSLVRAAADGTDEVIAGLLGSEALFVAGGALEAPENARLLLAAAGVVGLASGGRALRETPVEVRRVDIAPGRDGRPAGIAPPPRGVGDLADRIPSGGADAPQVRIERYAGPDGPRWIVYSAGTKDFGLEPAAQPYDMTSNLHAVAGASSLPLAVDLAAGERAVRDAMSQAGVRPGDELVVVGHSGGGIIAANLAADPDLHVVAAVNLGGPAAQVDTGEVPMLSVTHAEDLVPATGGSGVASASRIDVERSVGAIAPQPGSPVPAHALREYRATAELVDASDDPRLADFRRTLAGFTDGGAAEATLWRAMRVPAASAAGVSAPTGTGP
ncbi:hypothetical protein GCM10009819_15390 [Agromyces tropicus]|uniref:Alpha/beta hydrolase n=1 Tax=Agromyces tropicus TaxID=555371 RepID=A0ABN2UA57_9MICO